MLARKDLGIDLCVGVTVQGSGGNVIFVLKEPFGDGNHVCQQA